MSAAEDRPPSDELSGSERSRGPSRRLSVLVVDDNEAVARALGIALEVAGHRLVSVPGPEQAYSALSQRRFNAILLDLNFAAGQTGGGEGLACLKRILSDDPGACVVALTAHSGIRIAVAAMQAGARDFVMKPWRNTELVAKIVAAVARRPVTAPAAPASAAMGSTGVARLLGDSDAMVSLRALVRRIAPSDAGVLVRGRAGSGRSLVALALHETSPRAGAGVTLVDLRDREAWSKIDEADGTLVLEHPDRLDEVGQSRLLGRLPDHARIVAVADRAGAMEPALRQRLATVEIIVPPLSTRAGDAVPLARHFARLSAERHGRPAPTLSPAALDLIARTAWPDEVRGLALAIERAVLLSEDGGIDAASLTMPTAPPSVRARPATDFSLIDREKAVIEAALKRHRYNVTHAAAALGLSRAALYRRMTRHGL